MVYLYAFSCEFFFLYMYHPPLLCILYYICNLFQSKVCVCECVINYYYILLLLCLHTYLQLSKRRLCTCVCMCVSSVDFPVSKLYISLVLVHIKQHIHISSQEYKKNNLPCCWCAVYQELLPNSHRNLLVHMSKAFL